MTRLKVNPTRMVLFELKERLVTAKRGYKLLKDKQDELMRQFIQRVRFNMTLREKVEKALEGSFSDFSLASARMAPERLEQAVAFSSQQITCEIREKNLMSVRVPKMTFHRNSQDSAEAIPSHGFLQTSASLDRATQRLNATLEDLLLLAEVEKTCQLMADEIESTRRRVNALEYRTIPDLEETIRYIRMKLDENERATITRLMKVKEIIAKDPEKSEGKDDLGAEGDLDQAIASQSNRAPEVSRAKNLFQ